MEEIKRRVEEDADFVNLKRFSYSLSRAVERYPDGCPDRMIAAALLMTEEEVEAMYASVVEKLRVLMGVT